MKCKACHGNISESAHKINEWDFLEDMCPECIEVGRNAIYSNATHDAHLSYKNEADYEELIPGWASFTYEIHGNLVAFENEPHWDEDKEEWVVTGGQVKVLSFSDKLRHEKRG